MVAEWLVIILSGLAVGLVAAALAGLWLQRQDRQKLLRKLQQITEVPGGAGDPSPELFRHSHQQLGQWWKLVQRTNILEGSSKLLEEAGLAWSPAFLTKAAGVGGALGWLLTYLVAGSLAGAFVGLAVGLALPSLYVRRVRAKRRRRLEEQLPEAIDLLGRAIRAGHALVIGFRLVGEESPEPIAGEFRRAFEEQKYGMGFEDSLHGLTRRIGLLDVRVLGVAILVQREIGGNLAEILDKLSILVRSRFTLRRQMHVYTAQGRLSGYVLGLMPIVLGGVMSLVNPGYLTVLFQDPMGRTMLAGAICLQLVGYFWIWRILDLDL